jgi:hypothetical protein
MVALRETVLQLLDHSFKIGKSDAKAPGKPVSAALRQSFTIGQDRELPGLARRNRGFNAQPFSDESGETRRLGLIGRSSCARTYLDFHSVLQRRSRNPINVFPDFGDVARSRR